VLVLVTGAGGQVATDFARRCEASGDEVVALGHQRLDVTDRDAVLGAVGSVRPEVVVHCAAWTAVDACQGDPERAFAHNALAVRWVAEGCRRFGSHLVQLSTDYVFSGEKAEPYVEWDPTGPLSVYGASKLAGELEAMGAGIGATIVRTSWVVGQHGQNMVKTILRLLAERPRLSFVDDQRGHPTFTADLAGMVRRLALDRRPGIHHVTNQGSVSWFELAREVASAAGRDPSQVEPIATKDLHPPRPAPRPANSVLDNAVLRLSGLPLLPDFRETLPKVVRAIVDGA
ncbi:MAG TPA: dTDP-4-dehydrorhamnose reductase, partial [Acidimicrobiales bacterium]|nr:dTDP-4-dehydrorhamnose reductase [Acidimicrobiales bacterium]